LSFLLQIFLLRLLCSLLQFLVSHDRWKWVSRVVEEKNEASKNSQNHQMLSEHAKF